MTHPVGTKSMQLFSPAKGAVSLRGDNTVWLDQDGKSAQLGLVPDTGERGVVSGLEKKWRERSVMLEANREQSAAVQVLMCANELTYALRAQPAGDGEVLDCGHHNSLMLKSAETGLPLYCELCDARTCSSDNAIDAIEWKERALAAEADIERMTDAFNRENGPTFKGEPVLPPEKMVELEPGVKVPVWLLDHAQRIELYMKLNLPGPWRIGGIQSHDWATATPPESGGQGQGFVMVPRDAINMLIRELESPVGCYTGAIAKELRYLLAAAPAQPAGGGEGDAVLAERTALLNAGGPLANIAFNLAQSPRLTADERDSLDKCRKAWDAACLALVERHAPTQPMEGGESAEPPSDEVWPPDGAIWLAPVATDAPANPKLMQYAWGRSSLSSGQMAEAYQCIVSAAQECGQVYRLPVATPPESGGQGEAVRYESRRTRSPSGDWCEWQRCSLSDHEEIRAGHWDHAESGRKWESRALYTHHPAQAIVAVTEAMVLAACRAHDPMYESCGSDTRADMRAGIRRALEAALAQGEKA